jgi:hypothetical protein
MRNVLPVVAVVAALMVSGSPATANEANDSGACRQAANDAFVAASDEGTRGDFMSDVIFGNEPNMANNSPGGPEDQAPGSQAGNVLATWSPGPFVNTGENEPPRNDRTMGFGGGDLQALVRAVCN